MLGCGLGDEGNRAIGFHDEAGNGLGKSGGGVEREMLEDGGDNKLHFHEGEAVADAFAGAGDEGEVAIFGAAGDLVRGEAVGVELVGLGPVGGMVVEATDINDEFGTGGDVVGAELVIFEGLAEGEISGGIVAEGFINKLGEVG